MCDAISYDDLYKQRLELLQDLDIARSKILSLESLIRIKDDKINEVSELSQAFEEVLKSKKDIEHRYRMRLWLSHGHLALYGDDGEMQCTQCKKWDYLRTPIDELELQIEEMVKLEYLQSINTNDEPI